MSDPQPQLGTCQRGLPDHHDPHPWIPEGANHCIDWTPAPQARPAPPPPKMIAITTTPSDDSWARDAFVAAGEAQGEASVPNDARMCHKCGSVFMTTILECDSCGAEQALIEPRVDAGAHPALEQDAWVEFEKIWPTLSPYPTHWMDAEELRSKGLIGSPRFNCEEANIAFKAWLIGRAAHPESRGAAESSLSELREQIVKEIGELPFLRVRSDTLVMQIQNAIRSPAPPSSPGADTETK